MTKRYILFLAISTFILTVIWIASNVYHSYATSTIDPLLTIQIQEIPPDFDSQTFSELRKRTVVSPADTSVSLPSLEETTDTESEEAPSEETPEPSPTVIIEESTSPEPTETPSPTPEGGIQG